MRPLFMLDNRLTTCASFVQDGSIIADIGTDHAYLPIWLAKKGIIKKAVACDVNIKPLKIAEKNIKKYGVSNIVNICLSDGMKELLIDEFDAIIIAGMGAYEIVKILKEKTNIKKSTAKFILQPMAKPEVLREYLFYNNFNIIKERATCSNGRFYSVILAEIDDNKNSNIDPLYPYIGKLYNEPIHDNELLIARKEYTTNLIKNLKNKCEGYKANNDFVNLNKYNKIIIGISKLLEEE